MATNLQIPAIGDIHLQQDGRREQRLASWDRIITDGLDLPRLGAWLCLGDLFHAKSTAADRNDAARRLQAMANAAPVILLRGNHDHEGELTVFAKLKATHAITVVEHPGVVRIDSRYGAVSVACLPYPFKGMLAAMGLSPDEALRAGDGALLDICRELAAELADARADGDAVLFAAHVNVTGAIASSGQPNIGRELSIAAEHLALFADMPKVAGHIHKSQDIHGLTYAGSIARQSFGETEDKRYLVVALGPAQGQHAVSSRPLDVPAMLHVEGTLSREGFAHDLPAGTDIEGAEVRVRYRYAQSEQRFLDHASVRVPFAGAATLQVEPIAVPDRALRAPAVAQAVTLADKLTAWALATDTVTPASVLEKLARLQTQDEATLRASVEAWLAQAEGLAAQESGKQVAA
ncbi:metallophosphoesterase [Luteitalea sp.]|uniref:metallophosphoesterase family protein n=1 Tax=Luteitalea sp. TaxID=2004800 RepID=UPI0025C4798B|nr:metallophosphoesterase [Luteitalea sp.]